MSQPEPRPTLLEVYLPHRTEPNVGAARPARRHLSDDGSGGLGVEPFGDL